MATTSINCPQCGDTLPLNFRHTKLVHCESCSSAIFMEDDSIRLIGEQSLLSEEPCLLERGVPIEIAGRDFVPVGQIRFNYERGYWEEWWIIDNGGQGWWLSIDEGDYVLEQPLERTFGIPFESYSVGATVEGWQVTEVDRGTCAGFMGELPEMILPGQSFRYAHLSRTGSKLLTVEFDDDGGEYQFEGEWIDPFEIKVRV